MKPNTYIKPSKIHGLGLFALVDIKSGEEILHGNVRISEDLDEWIQYTKTCKQRSFTFDRGYCMLNHSITPNTVRSEDVEQIFASMDIRKGEEITEDYYALPDDHNPFINNLEEVIYRGRLASLKS